MVVWSISEAMQEKFSIKISPPVQEILDFYHTFNPNSEYISLILDESHRTPEHIKNRIKSRFKRVNKHLKGIVTAVGIGKKLIANISRHSYALILKK